MLEDGIRYLHLTGLVSQSIETLLPKLPRWLKHLEDRGYDSAPNLCWQAEWSFKETLASNDLSRLLAEDRGDEKTGHYLRNLTTLTGNPIRPFKS
jgi:hypothetical protein